MAELGANLVQFRHFCFLPLIYSRRGTLVRIRSLALILWVIVIWQNATLLKLTNVYQNYNSELHNDGIHFFFFTVLFSDYYYIRGKFSYPIINLIKVPF